MNTSDHSIARSLQLYERACRLIPGGTQLVSRRPSRYAAGISPIYAEHAKGVTLKELPQAFEQPPDPRHLSDSAKEVIARRKQLQDLANSGSLAGMIREDNRNHAPEDAPPAPRGDLRSDRHRPSDQRTDG